MPSEVRFAEVRRQLEQHGWSLVRIKGSHHVFQGPGRPTLSIPVHGQRVKAGYVRRIEEAIREIERGGQA